MKKAWLIAVIPGVMVVVAAVFVVMVLLVKALWAWTVPDLFPGAVAAGLIAKEISWYAALKVAIFIAVLAGLAGGARGKGK